MAAPVGQTAGPDDGARVAAVADGPDAELDLHGGLGPLVGRDVASVPRLLDDVVDGEAEVRGGPFDAVFVRRGEGGGVEAVGCVVGVEERLAVVEVVCLGLIFEGTEEFLLFQAVAAVSSLLCMVACGLIGGTHPVDLVSRVGLEDDGGDEARAFDGLDFDADFAKEEVFVAGQSWGLAVLPDSEGGAFSIRIVEAELAFVLSSRRVDGPEGSELVIPGGLGEVKGGFAGECGIGGTICG